METWTEKVESCKRFVMERKFGFFTEEINLDCGDIKISTLPETKEIKKTLMNGPTYTKILFTGRESK